MAKRKVDEDVAADLKAKLAGATANLKKKHDRRYTPEDAAGSRSRARSAFGSVSCR